MNKHSPTPWKKGPVIRDCPVDVRDKGGLLIADFFGVEREENARRTLACVNACEGINPETIPKVLAALQIAEQMLAALQLAEWTFRVPAGERDEVAALASMRAAITAAEGQRT